jgi:toxoflavin synthase
MTSTQFDQLATMYDRSIDLLPWRRPIEMHSVLTTLGDLTGLRALDWGCGSGLYSRLLADHGAQEVTGVDQSASMIDYARQHEERQPRGVRYEIHDAEDHTASDGGGYDVVLAVYLLPYAKTETDLRAMCATARNALATGGRFVIATLNPDFATSPHYYQPYHFDLTLSRGTPPHDGDPVQLQVEFGGDSFDVTARYWSRAMYERALNAAGFTTITWTSLTCSPDTDPAEFAAYLRTPHSIIITAQ